MIGINVRRDIPSRGKSSSGFQRMVVALTPVLICINFAALPSGWNTQGFKRKSYFARTKRPLAAEPAPRADVHREGRLEATEKGGSMQLKSILAAAGMLVAFAVLMPLSALAQQPVAGSPAITPVCANCHENQHLVDHADRPRRQERRQRQHVPGLPRRRLRAPAGSDEEQAGEPAQEGSAGGAEGRGVHDLPRRQPPPGVLGHGQARAERGLVQQLPQHPRQAGQRDRRAVHDVVPAQ